MHNYLFIFINNKWLNFKFNSLQKQINTLETKIASKEKIKFWIKKLKLETTNENWQEIPEKISILEKKLPIKNKRKWFFFKNERLKRINSLQRYVEKKMFDEVKSIHSKKNKKNYFKKISKKILKLKTYYSNKLKNMKNVKISLQLSQTKLKNLQIKSLQNQIDELEKTKKTSIEQQNQINSKIDLIKVKINEQVKANNCRIDELENNEIKSEIFTVFKKTIKIIHILKKRQNSKIKGLKTQIKKLENRKQALVEQQNQIDSKINSLQIQIETFQPKQIEKQKSQLVEQPTPLYVKDVNNNNFLQIDSNCFVNTYAQ